MVFDSTAVASLSGYLYQIEYALFILLKSDDEDAAVSIERIDDIDLDAGRDGPAFFQLKQHLSDRPALLSDYSSDLWKTIRIWATKLKAGDIPAGTRLVLISTAKAPNGSIAAKLRTREGRNIQQIATDLSKIATESTNQSLQPAFAALLALTHLEIEQLVQMIDVVDAEPNLLSVSAKIKPLLRARPQHTQPFYDRIIGWWWSRAKIHLLGSDAGPISWHELNLKLNDIRDQFTLDSLPIDYRDVTPEESDIPQEQRNFVKQLTLLSLKHSEINRAITDYYRAFQQRSRWEREKLLFQDELRNYENRLIDEWSRVRDQFERSHDFGSDENLKVDFGRTLYDWSQSVDRPRIRERVTEPYVSRGSYHILANQVVPQVWWHPDFVQNLQELVEQQENIKLEIPQETHNLFNSAFSARILRKAISGYKQEADGGFPYALSFLILPITLHKGLREQLPATITTKMHVWLREHKHVHIEFAPRAQKLVPITRDGLIFGLNRKAIELTEEAKLVTTSARLKRNIPNTQEIIDIENRAQFVGRWFARTGTTANIFTMWGVQP